MKLFSPVGIEPTFAHISYLDFKEPESAFDHYWHEEEMWRVAFADEFVSFNKRDIKNLEVASWGNVEVPSPVFKSVESLEIWFKKLCSKLGKTDWYPSTFIEEETEGGCHINYTITSDPLYALCLFVKLNQILNAYPSIVWSFLSYNDNHSSRILTKKNIELSSKEQAVCIRYCSRNVIEYLHAFEEGIYMELRFFQMPKTVEELEFHIRFSTRLMRYANLRKKNIKDLQIPLTHSKKDLQNFTFEDAVENLKRVCRILRMDFKEFIIFGKVDNLRKRFELDKNYLV